MRDTAREHLETSIGEALLKRILHEGTPLIDGEMVTFVWQGPDAPQLIGDFNNWGWGPGKPLDLLRVGTEIWAQSVKIPLDAYIEYTYIRDGRRPRDPFNPRLTDNGLGQWNQFFRMPASAPTPLIKKRRSVPHGTVTRGVVEGGHLVVGGQRAVHLYQPPTGEPTPLLVVLDGQDYLKRARLPYIVDNLIAQGRIQPISLALVEHGGQARFVEYMCNESTIAFLLRHVLPLAKEHLNLLDTEHPGAYGVMGTSMSGLMALYTGARVPEIFGRVLCQSGSFAFEVLHHESVIFDLIERHDARPVHIWMDVGRFEFLLPSNRRMYSLLREKGYNVTYHEFSGEHNYTSWRDDLWRGLEALFPPNAVSANENSALESICQQQT